jgi:hypothetical protein
MSHITAQFEEVEEAMAERAKRAAEMVSDLERFLATALTAPTCDKGIFRWPMRYNASVGSDTHVPMIREPSRAFTEN